MEAGWEPQLEPQLEHNKGGSSQARAGLLFLETSPLRLCHGKTRVGLATSKVSVGMVLITLTVFVHLPNSRDLRESSVACRLPHSNERLVQTCPLLPPGIK